MVEESDGEDFLIKKINEEDFLMKKINEEDTKKINEEDEQRRRYTQALSGTYTLVEKLSGGIIAN